MGAALRRALIEAWGRRGAVAFGLWPISIVYRGLMSLRRHLYGTGLLRVERAPVPVIVVGNVVAGGAGKTPVVMALVRHLQTRGVRAGVVSRGYGREKRDCREVVDSSLARDVGDEPILIRRATGVPVFVAPARIKAARGLLERYPEVQVLVCDDGLQHYGLCRDIEICVFDQRRTGNGFLLPAGPLREPWPRPTDLVLWTVPPPAGAGFSIRRSLAPHALRADGSQVTVDELLQRQRQPDWQLWAVAGIAQPEQFFAMLGDLGLSLAGTTTLPDHACFEDVAWPTTSGLTLVCNEKDATKLWRLRPDALAMPLVVAIEPAFWAALDKLLMERAGPKLSCGDGHSTS